ncbi:MAG: FecR domain-containing protein [Chitinophagaceae bacterium]|nr:FecR domain-containing protein [Chitinophagaceae bacterium]
MEGLNHRIKDLIIKHLKDELTIEDQLELQEWADASDYNRELFHRLTNPDQLNKDLKEYDELRMTIREKIDARLKTPDLQERPVPNIFPISRRRLVYAAAAAALLFLFTISYFWLASRFDSSSKARPVPAPVAVRDVAPGGNKATLTLGNGSTIILENAADGQLTEQGDAHVTKQKNALSYTTALSHNIAPTDIIYNTLTTPRAGQFKVVLPDGTKVWLNNASSLRYPTSFSGTSREVELTGEAYFEVAKNISQPFSVKIPDATVHVLGTSFNIMAYNNENSTNTTLVEGSVKISQRDHQMLLTPGEQVQLDKQGKIKKIEVNVASVIAWKNGFFNFSHTDFQGAMRQLARWYDVDVVYKGTPPSRSFSGVIDRQLSLSQVLRIFENDEYTLTIDGKSIIVTSNQK